MMAVYEVFTHPIHQRYKAAISTKATAFVIILFLLTAIPPFLIAYTSQGFWIKEAIYREQPEVHFKHQMLLVLETSNLNTYVAWSTYENFNQLEQEHLMVPVVKTREEDHNRDGKPDKLHYNIRVPLLDTQQILAVKLIILFNYKLHRMSSLRMESMAYIHYTSAMSGVQLITDGELRLRLKSPLAHKGIDTRYNIPVINSTGTSANDFEFSNIFTQYLNRNVTTSFVCDYPVWLTGRGVSQSFVVQGTIRYPEEIIPYIPGFWYIIKWGWIQYLSILLIFILLCERIKVFVFQNQVIQTTVEKPRWKQFSD